MFLHFLRSLSLHGSSAIRFATSNLKHGAVGALETATIGRAACPCRAEFHLVKIWVLNRTSQLIDSQYMLGRFHFRCITQVAYSELLVSENHRKPIWTSHLSWRHLMSLGVAICSFPHLKLGWLDCWILDRYFEHRNAEFGEHFSCNKRQMLCTRTSLTQRKQHQTTSNKHPPTLRLPIISYNFLPPKTAQTVWVRERPGQLCSSPKHSTI